MKCGFYAKLQGIELSVTGIRFQSRTYRKYNGITDYLGGSSNQNRVLSCRNINLHGQPNRTY